MGLDELGWGYRGRQGASVRGHIDSILRIGMPRVDLGTDRFFYPRLTVGDTRGGGYPGLGFQHPIVGLPNMSGPQRYDWYRELLEFAHAKWPEAGYGYFLHQMREPGASAYQMPLWFGVPPIGPEVKPPPAPSGVYPGRGLIVLRAEESPAYWESPAPAVGMRLATPYGHFVKDSFCLTGFYGFNRPLMVNHAHATNYTGVDPAYSNSARSHTIVIVDRQEPNVLVGPVALRHDFTPRVKFALARVKGIFPGVDQTRALMLTREYLLDVSRLRSDHARDYLWIAHAIGHAYPDAPSQWSDSVELLAAIPDLGHERCCPTDKTWAVNVVQSSGGANRDFTPLGESWFQQRIGVRTVMLGEPGTRAYVAWSPVVRETSGQWRGRNRFAYGEDEPAGAAIVANRKTAATTFIAIHEPWKTIHHIRAVKELANNEQIVGVAVEGENYTDYLLLHLGDQPETPVTVRASGAAFRFADYAFVRACPDRVDVDGRLQGMRLSVGEAKPRLFLSGQAGQAAVKDGCLHYGELAADAAEAAPSGAASVAEAAAMPTPALATRWHPTTGLCLPSGGKGTITLNLRNNTLKTISAKVVIATPRGLVAAPATVVLDDFAPGAEQDVLVTIDAAKAPANKLMEIGLRLASGTGFEVPRTPLKVANGVAHERVQVASDFHETIYAPRYMARYWYMDSGAATELWDPLGFRRHDSSNASYPSIVRTGSEGSGKRMSATKVPRFAYFIPILIDGGPNRPKQLYEGGKHAHGAQSGLEHWFTEDWLVVRDRTARPGEEIAFDWSGSGSGGRNSFEQLVSGRDWAIAAEKMPGTTLICDGEGKIHLVPLAPKGRGGKPTEVKEVAAMFSRPHGYRYGAATFYPPGARLSGNLVFHPGEKPVGFTFCTEEEFAALVARWRAEMPTGQVSATDAARYRGAFMPEPLPPEAD
jgi:hypothetical protein